MIASDALVAGSRGWLMTHPVARYPVASGLLWVNRPSGSRMRVG